VSPPTERPEPAEFPEGWVLLATEDGIRPVSPEEAARREAALTPARRALRDRFEAGFDQLLRDSSFGEHPERHEPERSEP